MIIDDIALTMHPEVGPKTAMHLIECFGTAQNIYAATQDQLIEVAKLKKSIAKSIANKELHGRAEQEVEFITKNRIKAIASDSYLYPQRVKESCDYPHVIYVKGEIDLNRGHWISIVGTRKITGYGLKMCEQIVGELADMFPDLVVVSGLAYGVDVASHRAALNSNALTVGVLGHPLTYIYPPQHTDVARSIVDRGGALISEFHSTARPNRAGFVQRNRIIAALSGGTLIVESASKGGSLITADMADGYNRQVMAVPGRFGDPYSNGTNDLIKNLKAEMVTSCRDIVTILDWDIPTTPKNAVNQRIQLGSELNRGIETQKLQSQIYANQQEYSEHTEHSEHPKYRVGTERVEDPYLPEYREHTEPRESQKYREQQEGTKIKVDMYQQSSTAPSRQILDMINSEVPISVDELAINLGLKMPVLSALLLDLEFSGKIRALPGKQYIRI